MSDSKDRSTDPHRTRARTPWPWATLGVALLGIGGAALVVLSSGEPASTPAPAPPLAEFAEVEATGDAIMLRSEGFVRARDEIALVSEVEGRIASRADGLRSGARVDAGELLVQIDPALHEAALQQARADLSTARSELERARNQVDRISALASEALDSRARLEAVQVSRDAAAARVQQAEAAVERARIRLADTSIRSPFDAEVVAENAAPGRFLRPGETVARLAAVGSAEIEVGLAPAQAALLTGRVQAAAGLPARVHATAGALDAVVDRIQPRIDPDARTLDVVVRVDDGFEGADGAPALRLGELARVEIEVPAARDWWRVPPTAIRGSDRLWRLTADDRLEAVDVEIVLHGEARTVVRGALKAGDRILTTDLTAPAPGLEVRSMSAVEAASSTGPEGAAEDGR